MGWDDQAATAPLVVHPTDLRSLIEASLDAVLVADARGAVRFLNPAASRLLGRSVQEAIGTALEFSPDQSKANLTRPDNSTVELSLRWAQLIWEGNLSWAAFMRDIWPHPETGPPPTDADLERRAAQAELRCEQLEEEVHHLKTELESAVQRARSAEAVIDAKEEELSQVRAQADFLEQRAQAAEVRAKEAEDQALDGWVQADDMARAAEEKSLRLSEEIARLDGELELSRKREAELRAEQETGPPELAELETRARAAETELARQLEQLSTLEHEVQTLREKAASRESEGDEENLNAARTRAQLSEARVAELEQQLYETEQRVLEAQDRSEHGVQQLRRAEEQVRNLEENLRQAAHHADSHATRTDHETKRLAFEDRLTGLPNFNILQQYLDYTVGVVSRGEGAAALLMLDIDRFRTVNSTLGHQAGDDLLFQVAERLKAQIRPADVLGRRREDEFLIVVVLESSELQEARATVAQMATSLATRILTELAESFETHGMSVNLTASMGLALFSGTAGETSQILLEQAHTALERARELGRARYHLYSIDLQERARKRIQVIPRLRQALENQEFLLLYQPIVDLKQGKVSGVEAFLRWNDPTLGLIEPIEFLEAAEESGLIIPIGEWVVQEACLLSAQYKDLFVSINLSPRQLMHADFARRFMKAVERARAKPQKLVVEIREDTSALDPERMGAVLGELARWGVGIAIDDFGSGSSSLKRLDTVRPRFLKIDAAFISGLPDDRQSWHIGLAICQLAASLMMHSLAEGVETAEQVHCLRQFRCHLGQGHYFSPPVPAAGLKELVKKTWKLG